MPHIDLTLSTELKMLFKADQADRADQCHSFDLKKMIVNDKPRLARAHEIRLDFENGQVDLSADDLYHLAMLFQHGTGAEDFKLAMHLATLSGQKGNARGKWLSAAAEDRYLLATGQKQKWGTQFRKDEKGEWRLQPMMTDEESGITDVVRKERGVPERACQLEVFLRLKRQKM